MKRFLFGGIIVVFALVGLVTPVHASVDDFSFKEFVGDYYLSRDDEGRSRLKVVETFVAEFPELDQNKGLFRAIPAVYDGHTVDVQVESLTRGGQPEPIYDQRLENGYWVVETGDDTYVRGEQVYVLTYTIRDTVKDFGGHQEFYGDTIGTNSRQSFGRVVGRVHLDESIRSAFTGDTRCFEGGYRDAIHCQVTEDGSTVVFSSNGEIAAHQNVTMVMKFTAGTFASYRMEVWQEVLFYVVSISAVVLSVGGLAWAIVIYSVRGRNARGRGVIVPEYLPPVDVSVLFSGGFRGRTQATIPAQLIDLAVRHKIEIIERGKKSAFSKKKKYTLRVLSIDGLSDDDERFIGAIMKPEVGVKYTINSADTAVGRRLYDLVNGVTESRVIDQGYRYKIAGREKPIIMTALGMVSAMGTSALVTIVGSSMSLMTLSILCIGIASLLITIKLLIMRRPLTEKGAQLEEYLKGLEMYIKVGEQERLQILQSPQGADKTPVDVSDTAQIVRLYERLLPYAVLFGLEKQWAKVLEVRYAETGTSPSWYPDASALNTVVLGSIIHGFTSSVVSGFSSPSNSSDSGFSDGGGFSGGGFGGGGVGGR